MHRPARSEGTATMVWVPEPNEDVPAQSLLGRTGARSGAFMRGFVGLIAGVAAVLTAPGPSLPVAAAIATNLVWTAVLVSVVLRRGFVTWVVLVEVAVTTVFCLSQGELVGPEALPGGASWVAALVTMAILVVNLAWQWWLAAPVSLLVVVAHLAGVRAADAGDNGVVTAMIQVIQVIAMAVMMRLLRRAARIADEELASASRAQRADLVERARRADEREHKRTMHDTVLATLTMVGTGTITGASGTLRHRAAGDLAVLDQLVDPQRAVPERAALADRLRVVATEAPVEVEVTLSSVDVPGRVADAFVGAVAEALVNAGRHAGTGRAWVCLTVNGETVEVEVRDAGGGFDQEKIPAHRYGVREAIVGRMAAVGASVDVHSGPGGTRLTLRWQP